MTPVAVVLRHLGALNAYETALVLAVAFGPFLVIAGLVLRERRRGRDRHAAVSQESEPSA
jgi:hypothetical protein